MISYELAVLRVAARHGWAQYRTAYPMPVVVGLILPRVVFQMAFLTLIGGLASLDSQRFAFVGASVQALTLAAVMYAGVDVSHERYDGTAVQIRLSRASTAMVRIVHSWVYVVEGLVFAVVGTLAVGAVLGYGELSLRLVTLLPLYVLAAVSMLGFGLTAATLSPAGLEVVLVNLATAVLLVLSGAVFPLSHLGPLATVSHVLPGVNALLAIRSAIDGGPIAGLVVAECAVAVLWLTLAVLADQLGTWWVRLGLSGRADGG